MMARLCAVCEQIHLCRDTIRACRCPGGCMGDMETVGATSTEMLLSEEATWTP